MSGRAGRLRAARRGVFLALAAALLAACGACGGASGPEERGDRLMATGAVDEAIAEYKLALRTRGEDPAILLRLGSAYAGRGEVEASLQYLRRTLEQDSSYKDVVAVELTRAARVAMDDGSPDNMARALEMVLPMGMAYLPPDLKLELARYYADLSDYGHALPLYLSALDDGDTEPATWLATAVAFQEVGGCREALDYFELYLDSPRADRGDGSAARFQYGQCLFEVAEQDRSAGRTAPALEKLDLLIDQGVPRTLLDRAHFARGEIMRRAGNLDAAEAEYEKVRELNPARTGPLVRLAEERIREIRYGKS
ncbi:MAG: tetratricopeptide repeat protein [Gemmatimonadales bacterium]